MKDKKLAKSNGSIKKAKCAGPLKIGDFELDCYVLEDGTALINKTGMMKVIGRQWKGESRTISPNFIGAKNIQPFISNELKEKLEQIDFIDGNKRLTAYNADILPLVCDVYLSARLAGVLNKKQDHIAQKCEIIVRSLSRIGIVALIYEATGYERFKSPDIYRLLVEKYVIEEARDWTKEFYDQFWEEMDRIYENTKTSSRNRPLYYGNFINKYIYGPIENGIILEKLNELNPVGPKKSRKKRLHQFLSEEQGLRVLRDRISKVTGILQISPNKSKFESNYARLESKQLWLFDELKEN